MTFWKQRDSLFPALGTPGCPVLSAGLSWPFSRLIPWWGWGGSRSVFCCDLRRALAPKATGEGMFAGVTTEQLRGQQERLAFLISPETGGSGLLFSETMAGKEMMLLKGARLATDGLAGPSSAP